MPYTVRSMRGGGCAAALLALALGIALAAGAARADPPLVPVGGEFRVNDATAGAQYQPALDRNPAGDVAVAWTDDTNIKVRVYDPAGAPRTGEILANSTTPGTQNEPEVAIADSGAFVVCWSDYTGVDGDYLGVLAQRFDPLGGRLGGEFVVTEVTQGSQWKPRVGRAADGTIVFVWVDSIPGDGSNAGVFGRIFDADGTPRAGQFLVNDAVTAAQVGPSLAVAPDGSFVVAWHDRAPVDGSFGRIVSRPFDPGGSPLSPGVQVNLTTEGDQSHPSVAIRSDGSYVVAWTDWGGADGEGAGIFFRFFDGGGAPASGEFRANETTAGDQAIGEVAWDGDSVVLVTWTDYAGHDGSGAGVFCRPFDPAGDPLGPEARVNSTTGGHQLDADLVLTPSRIATVVWEDQSGGDGDSSGIFAQRYSVEPATAVPGPGAAPLALIALLLALAGGGLAAARR